MYRDTKPTKAGISSQIQDAAASAGRPRAPEGKINTICDAVLKSLQGRKNAGHLQNIITANVCKNPPAIEDGLAVVAELLQEDESLAEKAVEHICFLVDVNKVYDQALGLYNLDLALLVAQQSQRDPREYLPFIQNLYQMEPLRRQFAIDDHLERRSKALGHLQKLDAFEEVKKYTSKYELYRVAMGLYRYDESHLRILTDLYAGYLESKSKFREAGLAYESLENFVRATACYQAAGTACWRECLFVAQQQAPPLSESGIAEIASMLADALYEAKDYAAAATIHIDYLGSVEMAARCLCKGYHFADALRLVSLKQRTDLLETTVDTGLADALSSSTEFLADCNTQLKSQVPRILELRRKAVEDPLAFYEGERPYGAGGGDIPDDVSIAASSRISTGASLFTRYTGKAGSVGTVGSNVSRATSKNRRREEKKRARGRKGTVYEEEYLVNSVRRLIERVEGTKAEVERLVFGLARRGMAERARAVETLMGDVLEACRVTIKEIWPEAQAAENAREVDEDGEEVARTGLVGGNLVLQEHLNSMRVKQEAPVVGSLEKLSLLG
jgi:elongator complex protein 1